MIKITDVDKNENTLRSIRTPKSFLENEKEIHDTIESHHKVIYKPNAAIKRRKQKKHKNSTHKTKEMESFEPVEETKVNALKYGMKQQTTVISCNANYKRIRGMLRIANREEA